MPRRSRRPALARRRSRHRLRQLPPRPWSRSPTRSASAAVRSGPTSFISPPDGTYCGFDPPTPLARAGGKAAVIRDLAPGRRGVILAGDGATDAEARHATELFVGIGGVRTTRPSAAPPTLYQMRQLAPLLDLPPAETGRARLLAEPAYRDLVVRGPGLLVAAAASNGKTPTLPWLESPPLLFGRDLIHFGRK